MTRKIFKAIMAVAAAVLAASILILLAFLYPYFGNLQAAQLEDELTLAVAGVEADGQTYLEAVGTKGSRLTWVDPDGTVLFDTQADAATMENHAARQEIREALEGAEGKSSRYSTTVLRQTLYLARRLSDGSVLRISTQRATVWIVALGMFQGIALVVILALILSGVLAGKLSRSIVKPLEQLNLDQPLENETYEELTPLLNRIYQQRRQIDEQVRELKRKSDEFSQVTGSMSEGLVLLNERGTVLHLNAAAKALYHADDHCLGRDFLTVERSPDISKAVSAALNSGHSETHLEREGREYQLDMSRIHSGNAGVGVVILSFDITDKAAAERSRREFTANVSHELKTPLQSIMGSAELIEQGLVKPEDMPRFVSNIRTEAARLVTLIEDIIRLSQLDEGGELPFEDVDLLDIAGEVASTLSDAAAAKGVTLTVSGDAAPIRSVRRLLTEMIYNLCDNAIKYNVPGGSVEVTVEGGERPALTVKDTGIGIPPEHQDRVFERFYRVDKSHSKASGGTGLGLSIVKHAAQSLGGRIEMESEIGKGTTVKITL